MKKLIISAAGLLVIFLCTAAVVTEEGNIFIFNSSTNQIPFSCRVGGPSHPAPLIQLATGPNGTVVFSVNGNGGLSTPGIQYGSVITDSTGKATNTFTTAFISAPTVVIQQTGVLCSVTNVLTITTTNFIVQTGVATQTILFSAFGTP